MPAATPADLKATLPAFAAVDDPTLQRWLDRAARVVDASWTADDQAHAQILLAAHLLTLNGVGVGAEAEMAAAGALGFRSMRSGALSLDRGDGAADAGMGEYALTSYGRQFYALLRVNRGGPRATGVAPLPFEAVSPWRF